MFPIQPVWNSFTSRFSSPRSWDGTTLTLTVPDPGLAEVIQARVGIQSTRILAALSDNPAASIMISTLSSKSDRINYD